MKFTTTMITFYCKFPWYLKWVRKFMHVEIERVTDARNLKGKEFDAAVLDEHVIHP